MLTAYLPLCNYQPQPFPLSLFGYVVTYKKTEKNGKKCHFNFLIFYFFKCEVEPAQTSHGGQYCNILDLMCMYNPLSLDKLFVLVWYNAKKTAIFWKLQKSLLDLFTISSLHHNKTHLKQDFKKLSTPVNNCTNSQYQPIDTYFFSVKKKLRS